MTSKRTVFSAAFAFMHDAVNPNAIQSGSYSVYEECLLVLFTTLEEIYPHAGKRLYVNERPREAFSRELEEIRVEIRVIPFSFSPPQGFMNSFQASLFTLDVVKNLSSNDNNVLLDPDVVANREYDFSEIWQRDLICGFDCNFDADWNSNGLSLSEIQNIGDEMNFETKPHKYLGGEFYAIPGSRVEELSFAITNLWAKNLDRWKAGKTYLRTEEHFLTLLLSQLDVHTPEGAIARIWTTPRYRRVPKAWRLIAFLHMPSEKSFGFRTAAKAIRGGKFADKDENKRRDWVSKKFHLTSTFLSLAILRSIRKTRFRIIALLPARRKTNT